MAPFAKNASQPNIRLTLTTGNPREASSSSERRCSRSCPDIFTRRKRGAKAHIPFNPDSRIHASLFAGLTQRERAMSRARMSHRATPPELRNSCTFHRMVFVVEKKAFRAKRVLRRVRTARAVRDARARHRSAPRKVSHCAAIGVRDHGPAKREQSAFDARDRRMRAHTTERLSASRFASTDGWTCCGSPAGWTPASALRARRRRGAARRGRSRGSLSRSRGSRHA